MLRKRLLSLRKDPAGMANLREMRNVADLHNYGQVSHNFWEITRDVERCRKVIASPMTSMKFLLASREVAKSVYRVISKKKNRDETDVRTLRNLISDLNSQINARRKAGLN